MELDRANAEAEALFLAHALVACDHCGRRFRREALRKHRSGCTASRPFAQPLGRKGATGTVGGVREWR